jgi:uncharacterized iron-regulated protein
MAKIGSTRISVQKLTLTSKENRSGVNALREVPRATITGIPISVLKTAFLCTLLLLLRPTAVEASAAQSCSEAAAGSGWQAPGVIAGDVEIDFNTLIGILADSRVVFVGESHDRYDHHLNQLEIICRLHRRDPDMVIAMEFFQQPFQAHLDDFIAGRIDTEDMLRATDYYNRWRFDYRLYEAIMGFARTRGIAIVALNVAAEITTKVGLGGIDDLSEEERASLPGTMVRSDEQYRERIKIAFEQHPEETRGDFERFFQVQLLWDEGMAERAAGVLVEHPESQLVVLAGTGHVIRSGIPARLARRGPGGAVSVVLQGGSDEAPSFHREDGDFMLVSKLLALAPAGMLGVLLDIGDDGVSVQSFVAGSAAEQAGLETGDRLAEIQGRPVSDLASIKMGLLGKRPGDTVSVTVERKTADGSVETRLFDVTLR